MLRVVLDTIVFVRCLINPHARCGRLVFAHSSRYRLFLSRPVMKEIIEVLQRPELRRKFSNLERLDFAKIIEILGQAEVVEIGELALSRDPKDNKFLATAEAAAADYLVSEDNDLLVIKEYRGTRIVDSATVLEVLEERVPRVDP